MTGRNGGAVAGAVGVLEELELHLDGADRAAAASDTWGHVLSPGHWAED
ncbi:hypothetical protein ACFC6L_07225 [Kitasatospora phosalacinea]